MKLWVNHFMQKLFRAPFYVALLLALMFSPLLASAAPDDSSDQDQTAETTKPVDAPAALGSLQKRLDTIKQQVSTAKNDKSLSGLSDDALKLGSDADALGTALQPLRAQVQAKLDVLGPAPATGALPETPQVIKQRKDLNASKTALDNQIQQAGAIKTSANNLAAQIGGLRRDALKTQLALNTGSIFGSNFWSALTSPTDDDVERFGEYRQQMKDAWHLTWQPEWRVGSGLLLLAAILIGVFGSRVLDIPLAWLTPRWLPEGRLRRSFFAFATAAITIMTLGGAAKLFSLAFTRMPDVSEWVAETGELIVRLSIFSALIVGLGRSLLSIAHPSWRLPGIADPVAKTLDSFPKMLSAFILIFGLIEGINNLVGTSISVTLFGNGLSALLVAISAAFAPMRVNRLRRKLLAKGEQPEARSTLAGLLHLATSVMAFAIFVALVVGYVPLARFLTYELLWIGTVVACLYTLMHLAIDLSESLFSPSTASGRLLKHSLSLNDRHLSLAATLLSAVAKTVLLLTAVTLLLGGNFGTTTPLEIFSKVVDVWGGKGLEHLNIIPAHMVNALIFLIVGWYVLRSARRWLDNDFLPKTNMDRGMRASLVTLFSNVGLVLLILVTLSVLGIEWNRLAWIVSALSVGIGFGLQEIVKNFISGLILLTERPVKVGDLVSIGGVEGDIRRINVRATELQLSDRSTVIVPNSQFISQNVRNATMGNAQGVATIALTFPLDIDPEEVRNMLLEAYEAHDSIMETPAPSVSFSQLGPDGIVLSVTGYVNSPRVVSRTKSDLLYEILKKLREAGVSLSRTQTMVLANMPERGVGNTVE
jgi:potassium efflux system protein